MGLINLTDIQDGDEANEELFNSRFATIVDVINGNIDNANISDSAISTSKLANNAVTAAKIEAQQAWQAVAYTNSWVDYDTTYGGAQYYKDSLGIVHLRGLVKNGSSATAAIFTLPAGYRPGKMQLVTTFSNSGACRIDISTAGVVTPTTNASTTWTSLFGISFRAEG